MPKPDALTEARIVGAVVKAKGYTRNQSFKIVEILLVFIKSVLESGNDAMISGLVTSM
jgi:nucleoid DNA-binding protein